MTGRFWSADEFNHWKREYENRRGDLQKCGTRAAHDDNRHGEEFECQKCGYQNHADYNASKNIGL